MLLFSVSLRPKRAVKIVHIETRENKNFFATTIIVVARVCVCCKDIVFFVQTISPHIFLPFLSLSKPDKHNAHIQTVSFSFASKARRQNTRRKKVQDKKRRVFT